MDNSRSTALERSILTFCVEGLPAREELLFKSFVRLLDHLTHQQWRYHPPATDTRVDLLVVAKDVQPTYSQRPGQAPQPVLQLGSNGTNGANGHGFLSWPLNPAALEKELNRLGGLAITQRSAPQEPALGNVAVTSTPVGPTEPASKAKPMRLQQWPPAHLLTSTDRMRLATLLTSKAMSLKELVHRSALPLPVCEAFVNDMLGAQLLVTPSVVAKTEPPRHAPAQEVVQHGLLARIRMRLGINT